jgi:hypothetical protein
MKKIYTLSFLEFCEPMIINVQLCFELLSTHHFVNVVVLKLHYSLICTKLNLVMKENFLTKGLVIAILFYITFPIDHKA